MANLVITITGKDGSKAAFSSAKEGALLLKQAQIETAQAATKLKEETIKLKQAQTENTQASIQLKTATISHQQAQEANTRVMTAHKIAMDYAKLSSSNLTQEVDKGTKANKDFEDSASNMSDHSIIKFGLLEEAGRKVFDGLLAIGEKAAGAGKEVVSVAGDYQQNMLKLQFLTGNTTESMQAFNKEAIDIGKTTSFSSKEAMEAMADLAQMGYKQSEIVGEEGKQNGILAESAKAAMTNNEGLTQATETLTSTLHGFGRTSDEAKQTLDVMTRASQLGKISFDDFGKAAENVGLVSVSTGQAFTGTTAELLALTNTGMSAERSSQTLRFALTQIEKPSKAASETLEALGLSYYDSQGHMKQYADIVDEVSKRTAGMTDEQKQMIQTTLFSKNGVMAYNAALNAQATEVLPNGTTQILRGTEALRYNQKQLESSNGTMDKAVEIMKTGFNYQMKQMQGSIEEAMISVGTALLPGLTSIIKVVTENINHFIDWEQKTHTVGNALVTIGTIIGNFVVPAIGFIIKAVQEAIPIVLQFANYFTKNVLPPLLSLADTILKTVLPPLIQFGQWLFSVLLPQVIAVAQSLWTALQPAFKVIMDVIKALMPIIQQLVGFIEGKLMQILRSLTDNFNKYVAPAIANLATFIKDKVIPAIQDMWKWFAQNILPVIDQFVQFLTKTAIPVLAQWISFIVDHIIPILWTWWTIIASALKPIFEAIAFVISTVVIPAFTAIGKWMSETGIPIATKLADNFQNNFLPVIKGVGDFLGGTFGNVIKFVWGLLQGVGGFIFNGLIPAFGHLWDFISTYILPVFQTIANVVGTVVGGAFTGLNWILNNVVVPAFGFVGTIIGNVVNFIKGAINAIANFFIDAINTPLNMINSLIDMLKNAPVIGGVFSGMDHIGTIPHIQLFAKGTDNAPGGPAVVGEAGPELVNVFGKIFSVKSPTLLSNLPQGSQVIPLNGRNNPGMTSSNSTTTNSNQKTDIHNHYYIVNANYKYQEHDSLAADIRRLQMLNSRT